MRYLLLIASLLTGCATSAEIAEWNYRDCERRAVGLTELRETFMTQCLAITPENSAGYASGYSRGYNPGYAQGPYGPQGPTWGEFNRLFQPVPEPPLSGMLNEPPRRR